METPFGVLSIVTARESTIMRIKYRLNEKRKKLYLAIGFLASMVACGYMTTLDLQHMQNVEMQATVEPKDSCYYNTTLSAEIQDFDVPLSVEIQEFIIKTSEKNDITPELVIAVIEKESNYNSFAVGDGGDSKGLMQIQEKWHLERMKRLGCKDLINPYDNIKVGVDILAELTEKHGEIGGLVAYNQGYYDGEVTKYAEDVMKIKERIIGR